MKVFKMQFRFFLIGMMLSGVVLADLSGDWEGVLEINEIEFPLIIHLMHKNGQPSGTLDSPAQGGMDIAMTDIEFGDDSLMFEIAEIGVFYEGHLDLATGLIEGSLIQGGAFKLSFSPIKIDTAEVTGSSDSKHLLGQWGGTVEIPGNPLSLVVHVTMDYDQLHATADSPDQEAAGIVVDTISLRSGKVVFTMEDLGVAFIGSMSKDQQTIQGDFNQLGRVFYLELVKGKSPKQAYQRPQEPQPPFRYHVENVVVNNTSANLELAGTLTRPKDVSTIKAAAVMITGSGAQDRDETILNHKPFWVIADYLAQQGYAVLRLDDRGVGESTGDFSQATTEDFVTDINAAVNFMQQRTDIPSDKIGLIGHSEGGMIAPMLAAQRDDLSFIILLAAPGVPATELLAEQKYLIAKSTAHDEAGLLDQRAKDLVLHQRMAAWSSDDDFKAKVSAYVKASLKDQTTNEAYIISEINNILKAYNTPWFRYFIAYEPAKYLSQVKVPLLALNGEYDVQVEAESNLMGIEAVLKKIEHKDFTIRTLPKLNHLFQTSDTGSTSEYVLLTESFSPMALQAMSDWLNQRF
ncbi:MAG: alpha/beta superfamily hydrolase [Halioglobus sp.]